MHRWLASGAFALMLAPSVTLADLTRPEQSGRAVVLAEAQEDAPEIVGDAEYGAWLSGECTTCHRVDGTDAGIPTITGLPERQFVRAMRGYQRGARSHQVMEMIAKRLNDEEIAALAAYFATLTP